MARRDPLRVGNLWFLLTGSDSAGYGSGWLLSRRRALLGEGDPHQAWLASRTHARQTGLAYDKHR
jgi:hypothetical protein